MKELIEYIARQIVTKPEEVAATLEERGDRVVVRLQVAPEDKGKVIGREGRVAQAMRSLLRAAAVKQDVHASLEIE